MLHLPSKIIVISFAIDGIAMKAHGSAPKIIHQPEHGRYKNFDEIIAAFSKIASEFRGKKLHFILSNYFFRLNIMPWQENIYQKNDWIALADYALKQKTTANSHYVTTIKFNGFGNNILTASINSSYLEKLNKIAKLNQVEIFMIEPFLNSILNKKKNGWIIIAETGKALLLECSHKNWTHISSASILEHEEHEAMDAFIQRRVQLNKNSKGAPSVSAFLYPKLSHEYKTKKNKNTLNVGIIQTKHFASNAEWIAHF